MSSTFLNDWFANQSTRAKLFYSIGFLVVCIAAMLYIVQGTFQHLTENGPASEKGAVQRVLDLANTHSHLDALQMDVLSAANKPTDLAIAAINQHMLKVGEDIDSYQNKYPDGDASELARSFGELKPTITSLFSSAGGSSQSINLSTEQNQFNKVRDVCGKAFRGAQAQVGVEQSSLKESVEKNLQLLWVMGLVAMFVGVILISILNAVIADPLQQITNASEQLALGDLKVVLPNPDRKDEVGALIKAFYEVIESLNSISDAAQKVAGGDLTVKVIPRSGNDTLGGAFHLMVENMSNATGQIKNAVSILTSAVNNIMASVAESATGATQTATAVTETTTTVEEVRQTSHVANQKAKNVAESAQKSAQISSMGRKSTEETIQGMKRIREQMDLIADSMVRLSEKSQSIVEIIATVDDLAQQSNLLAVNASIEAAKAGELGRGFAVVAQEVKSMADQSKQATAQVRKILTEIQQATSSAAMATELGSRAVDAAVTQSNQAGEAITVLANSVIDSANAAAQIAVSSQQQLAGVDQVATAMLGIKDATAQNLVAIRHVEESAQSLHELGGMLKVILQRYQL